MQVNGGSSTCGCACLCLYFYYGEPTSLHCLTLPCVIINLNKSQKIQDRRPQLQSLSCQKQAFGSRCFLRKGTAQLLSYSRCHVTIASGVIMCVGGPALVYWVSPTEEELFKECRLKIATYKYHALILSRNTIQICRGDRWRTENRNNKTLTTSLPSSRNTPSPINQYG